jgi:soluble lytic murein transglycosylase
MQSVSSFIYERSTKYREQGFLTPYDEYLNDLSVDSKALIYAIMRQESRFIPSALSRAYALGLMQIMPFLAKSMQKKMPKKLNSLNDMFEPNKSAIRQKTYKVASKKLLPSATVSLQLQRWLWLCKKDSQK